MQSQVELADLRKAINAKLEQLITIKSTKDIDQDYTGYVVKFSDGVARVMGIKRARIGQRITFYSETINNKGENVQIPIDGMIMDIEPQWTECVVFGEERYIKEGQIVEIKPGDRNVPFTINFHPGLIGCVIDPLCNVQKLDDDDGGNPEDDIVLDDDEDDNVPDDDEDEDVEDVASDDEEEDEDGQIAGAGAGAKLKQKTPAASTAAPLSLSDSEDGDDDDDGCGATMMT